jgi:hypothetical protein
VDLLVGTHSFLARVELDSCWNLSDFERIRDAHHYGIALSENGDRLWTKPNSRNLYSPNRELFHEYDHENLDDPVSTEVLPGWFNDVHQVARANGGFYFANTWYNSLAYWSRAEEIFHEHFFNGFSQDINHINSVYPTGDVIFALLHNGSRPTGSQIMALAHSPSDGFEVLDSWDLWHRGCHNVFIDPPYLYYNASGHGRFVVANLHSGQREAEFEFGGHTKGLAATDDHLVIGVSEHVERDKRPRCRGELRVFDRNDHSPVTEIDLNHPSLPHSIGNVNEIRLISGDKAHSTTETFRSSMDNWRLADDSVTYRAKTALKRPQVSIENIVDRVKTPCP